MSSRPGEAREGHRPGYALYLSWASRRRLRQEAQAAQEVLEARIGIERPESPHHPKVWQVAVPLFVSLLQPFEGALVVAEAQPAQRHRRRRHVALARGV